LEGRNTNTHTHTHTHIYIYIFKTITSVYFKKKHYKILVTFTKIKVFTSILSSAGMKVAHNATKYYNP